jgi:hypothetical protein
MVDFALPDHNLPVVTNDSPDYRLLDARKLTIPQAARRLGIGETKMRLIVRNGEVAVVRLGCKVMLTSKTSRIFTPYGLRHTFASGQSVSVRRTASSF